MSTSEAVLRNIYSYLEVLDTAHSEKVSQWSTQSLNNAIQWGNYCEQIYAQSLGKAYERDLDIQIQRFNKRPWNLGGAFLRLDYLKNASQLLLNALLQNPFLSSTLYSSVIKACIDSSGKEQFIQVCSELSQTKASVEVAAMIETHLKPPESDRQRDEGNSNDEPDALLLHRYLKQTLKHSFSDQRTRNAISEKIENIGSTPAGLSVLLKCLQHSIVMESSSEIKDLLIPQIAYLIEGNADKKSFTALPRDLVTYGATVDPVIFSSTMRRLVAEADTMNPQFEPSSIRLTWKRSPCSDGMSYDAIVKQLEELRDVSDEFSAAVDGILIELSETKDNEVWRSLMRDVKR